MFTYSLKQNRPNSIPGPVQISRVRPVPELNILITYYTNDDMKIESLGKERKKIEVNKLSSIVYKGKMYYEAI